MPDISRDEVAKEVKDMKRNNKDNIKRQHYTPTNKEKKEKKPLNPARRYNIP